MSASRESRESVDNHTSRLLKAGIRPSRPDRNSPSCPDPAQEIELSLDVITTGLAGSRENGVPLSSNRPGHTASGVRVLLAARIVAGHRTCLEEATAHDLIFVSAYRRYQK